MSESSPFPTQTETRMEAVPTDDDATRSRRPLLALGGLAAALLLGAGGFLLLGGDDAEEDFAVVPPIPSADAPAPVPQEVFVVPADGPASVGRNPFLAQYLAPTGGTGADAGTGTTAGTGTGTTTGTTAAAAASPARQAAVVMESAPAATQPASEATQPAPAATQPAPAASQPAPAAAPAPSAGTPATTPAAPTPVPASPTPTEPPAAEDDGMRYPITLLATDTVGPDGGGPLVTWGFAGEAFDVQPGESFGRFDHLRVMQIIQDETREGVFLQLGDGAPFFVALDETVYVL